MKFLPLSNKQLKQYGKNLLSRNPKIRTIEPKK